MKISNALGLNDSNFSRMVVTTKMLFSNVLGHAAELHYEKHLTKNNIPFKKAPTDVHYDYVVNDRMIQVKRWESNTTTEDFLGVNLTKTHGNRNGPDAFYTKDAFDNLVVYDIGFSSFKDIKIEDIPINPAYADRLPGKFKIRRTLGEKADPFGSEFLKTIKIQNLAFSIAIEDLRKKLGLSYTQLLEKSCNLTLDEIDGLFCEDNFRLTTGAKGFAAEEHFNIFLEKHKIPYKQEKKMYSKVDHWVNDNIRVQVKIPNERANNESFWGVKTHKSHGHGKGELYQTEEFDVLALFIGFKIDPLKSKYLPVETKEAFLFIPEKDLPRHEDHKDCLKRISRIPKDKYVVNDLSLLTSK